MKDRLKILLRENLEIFDEDYYNPTIPDDDKRLSKRYEGRNVIWYGAPDQMIVIHKDNVHGMWGNIYNQEKMDYLTDLIINHEDKIEIECSYGTGNVVSLGDIVEEQTSEMQGTFQTDFDGLKAPRSTGDDELDRYLGTEYLDEFEPFNHYVENDELYEVFNENKIYVAVGKVSMEELMKEFKEATDGSEEDKEALKRFLDYEKRIKQAVQNKSGDIGKFTVQLRDGHHRVFGAINAGEEYVCLNLAKDDIEEFKGYYKKV